MGAEDSNEIIVLSDSEPTQSVTASKKRSARNRKRREKVSDVSRDEAIEDYGEPASNRRKSREALVSEPSSPLSGPEASKQACKTSPASQRRKSRSRIKNDKPPTPGNAFRTAVASSGAVTHVKQPSPMADELLSPSPNTALQTPALLTTTTSKTTTTTTLIRQTPTSNGSSATQTSHPSKRSSNHPTLAASSRARANPGLVNYDSSENDTDDNAQGRTADITHIVDDNDDNDDLPPPYSFSRSSMPATNAATMPGGRSEFRTLPNDFFFQKVAGDKDFLYQKISNNFVFLYAPDSSDDALYRQVGDSYTTESIGVGAQTLVIRRTVDPGDDGTVRLQLLRARTDQQLLEILASNKSNSPTVATIPMPTTDVPTESTLTTSSAAVIVPRPPSENGLTSTISVVDDGTQQQVGASNKTVQLIASPSPSSAKTKRNKMKIDPDLDEDKPQNPLIDPEEDSDDTCDAKDKDDDATGWLNSNTDPGKVGRTYGSKQSTLLGLSTASAHARKMHEAACKTTTSSSIETVHLADDDDDDDHFTSKPDAKKAKRLRRIGLSHALDESIKTAVMRLSTLWIKNAINGTYMKTTLNNDERPERKYYNTLERALSDVLDNMSGYQHANVEMMHMLMHYPKMERIESKPPPGRCQCCFRVKAQAALAFYGQPYTEHGFQSYGEDKALSQQSDYGLCKKCKTLIENVHTLWHFHYKKFVLFAAIWNDRLKKSDGDIHQALAKWTPAERYEQVCKLVIAPLEKLIQEVQQH